MCQEELGTMLLAPKLLGAVASPAPPAAAVAVAAAEARIRGAAGAAEAEFEVVATEVATEVAVEAEGAVWLGRAAAQANGGARLRLAQRCAAQPSLALA